ncbi:MAG: ABC transporter permease, partial [Chloroflexi bacterium]|nr:ABC transporter permease [Chloroflexota bacterium]
MKTYIIRRLLLNIPVLFLITIGTFGMLRLTPGDVVLAQMTDVGTIKKEDVEIIRKQLGLDKPFLQEYGHWVSKMFRGDMGRSLRGGYNVRDQLFHTLPISIELGIIAIIIGVLVGWPIGIISAIRQNSISDYIGRLFAIGGLSFPDFWLATMFVVFVPLYLGYLPRLSYIPLTEDPLANIQQFIWPGLIMGVRMSATTMRMLRSTMLEVLRQDYIRTAWSKGLRERAVLTR